MTSPAVTALDTIKTIVSALTPPTRADVVYRPYGGQGEPSGASADRLYWFRVPVSANPEAESGAVNTQVLWELEMCLRLNAGAHTRESLVRAYFNEGALVRRAFDKQAESSWGAGVHHVECGRLARELDQEDVIIIFPLTILTGETD